MCEMTNACKKWGVKVQTLRLMTEVGRILGFGVLDFRGFRVQVLGLGFGVLGC